MSIINYFPENPDIASSTQDGLMSKEDKQKVNTLDITYALKTELSDLLNYTILANGMKAGINKNYINIGYNEYASNSAYQSTPVSTSTLTDHFSNSSASGIDITFKFSNGVSNSPTYLALCLDSSFETPRCSILYLNKNNELIELEQPKLINSNKIEHYKFNENKIDSNIWVIRLMSTNWVNVKMINLYQNTEEVGLMNIIDKIKLDTIETGANYYVHPNNSDMRHVTDTEKETWNNKASNNPVTINTNGLMLAGDKSKLDNIEENANKYVHPETHDATMIAEDSTHKFVTDTQISEWSSKADNTTVTSISDGLMIAADKAKLDRIEDGANKYVHPSTHDATMITTNENNRFVTDKEKSSWNAKADTTIASVSAPGLMSAEDKSKLDNIATNANKYELPVAGTALGGIVSGNDITITEQGEVTVLDDSHLHSDASITSLDASKLTGTISTDRLPEEALVSTPTWNEIIDKPDTFTPSSHTHNYAGSAASGGPALSANKLNTDAGSATQPVYFSNGIPVAGAYSLNATVPSTAKFTDTTYDVATTDANGLMSSIDKTKLNSGIFIRETKDDEESPSKTLEEVYEDQLSALAKEINDLQVKYSNIAAESSGNYKTETLVFTFDDGTTETIEVCVK